MDLILVTGVPNAGKTSFADWVEDRDPRFLHLPLDPYTLPVPSGGVDLSSDDDPRSREAFQAWVRDPTCIDWVLLMSHLEALSEGAEVHTPVSDWSQSGRRLSDGGPGAPPEITTPGCFLPESGALKPRRPLCLVEGTHAFRLADHRPCRMKVFIETSDAVIAQRLVPDTEVSPDQIDCVIEYWMSGMREPVLADRTDADLVVSGTADHKEQYVSLIKALGIEPARSGDTFLS